MAGRKREGLRRVADGQHGLRSRHDRDLKARCGAAFTLEAAVYMGSGLRKPRSRLAPRMNNSAQVLAMFRCLEGVCGPAIAKAMHGRYVRPVVSSRAQLGSVSLSASSRAWAKLV